MLKFLRSKKGFTLVELMVVCIIVAILAAVVIPMMSANTMKAYRTEVDSMLGSIRTALRVFYAENNRYPTVAELPDLQSDASLKPIGLTLADITGTYFIPDSYTYTNPSPTTFTLTCVWNSGTNSAKVTGFGKTTVITATTGPTTTP